MVTMTDEKPGKSIRVVAAIDFGTTFSGFAYAHKKHPRDIFVHDEWQKYHGLLKTPTVIKYDKSFNLKSWGYPALAERPNKKNKPSDMNPVEKFKLHLSKLDNKPYLPSGLEYKTAITDYLREMGNVMKNKFKTHWSVDFFEQVLIIMTIPAEFNSEAIDIMRECTFNAGIIGHKNSPNLKFTTEPEAAAIHCINVLKELEVDVDSLFTVVDCGGGTVDLTTRQLLKGQKLGEKTERKGGYCGGSFVDNKFIEFLGRKVGPSVIDLLMNNHYCQLQYMVQEFCRRVKFPFTGRQEDFKPFDLDLDELFPDIKQYVKDLEHDRLGKLEEEEWTIGLKFKDVKEMFDPVIEEILRLIHEQLNASDKMISVMFLVGGFSESIYLQTRIKQEFNDIKISVPPQPMTAIVKGAVQFGLRQDVVFTRKLKWTYGTDVAREWKPGDPPERKSSDGMIIEFSRLAKRGDEVPVDTVVPRIFSPGNMFQKKMGLDLYITEEPDAKFCDTDDVKLLGNWSIDLPLLSFSQRQILFILTFSEIEIEATAFNFETNDKYDTTFELDIE